MSETAVADQSVAQPPIDPEQLKRAVLASSVGSALEYYDFYIYGLATALIIGPLFFSPMGSSASLIASFATYAVGFAARPIGGIVFGHLGDKLGRKLILVITIVLMGGSSFLIGILPTYSSVGVVAPILLILLRVIQGLGAGAEQAGATVLVSEFAPAKKRGFFAALPFVGIHIGTLLGAGTFALLGLAKPYLLQGWLWRVPFLAGAALVFVAVYIRSKLKESPAFEAFEEVTANREEPIKMGVFDAIHSSRRNILIGIGLRMAENGNSTIYSALLIAFLAKLDVFGERASTIGPAGAVVAAVISIFTVVILGALSDKYGRVKVYRFGAGFLVLFSLPAFYLVTLGNIALVLAVMGIGIGIGVQGMLGPQCAMLPEMFGNAHRYTGVAMSREISAVLAGGIAPMLGACLLMISHNSWWTIGLYACVLSLISFCTTFAAPETAGRSLTSFDDAR